MPTFSSAQVTDPFLSQNELLAPMLAHIAAQEKLGNLDVNRQELKLRQDAAGRDIAFGDYLKQSLPTDGTTGSAIPGDSTPFERKMGFSEGGGTADKVNSEGYAGQYQFGAARLADLGLYTPAQGEDLKRNEWKGTFKIAPYGVANLQDFLKNPAAQHAAFVAHVADVDKVIDATPGADKFDRNGLRAVAHLGGNGGMQAFVASGGNLNRADSNGTSLKAYYQKFADGGAPALQKAFGAAHGPGGPQSNAPAVAQPTPLNPNAGPRVAGVPSLPAPDSTVVAPAPIGQNPNAQVQIPPPVQTSEADVPVPVAPSPIALRTGGTDVAGPGAGSDVQPNRMAYGTGLPGVTIGLPTNGMAPPVQTAAAPVQAQPQAASPQTQPPPAPSRVIQREPLIQSGIFAGLTRTQASTIANTPGVKPAQIMDQIATARHQNDVIRQGDATQAAIDEKENYARWHQSQQDARQRENDKAAAQKAAEDRVQREIENKRAEGAQKLSQAANDREAAKAHEENLNNLTPKIEDGTATPAEKRLYAGSYYALQQQGATATTMDDPNNPGQKIPAMITRRLPKNFPEPEGGALPLVMSSPGAPTAAPLTETQGKAAGYADRVQQALPVITDTSPAAMSRWQMLLGKAPILGNTFVSPEFQLHQQSERNFINAVLRRESGAAINPDEFVQARQQYIPQPGDSPQVLAEKAKNRETVLAGMIREAGPGYKPATASPASTQPPAPKVIKFDATGKRVSE